MKRLLLALLAATPLLLIAEPAAAQSDPAGSLFIGYSYLRVNLEDADEGDAHGAEVDYTFYMVRRVGFTLSASAHWGNLDAFDNDFNVPDFEARQLTFLAGPQFVLWRGLTTEGGLRGMIGVTNRRLDTQIGSIRVSDEWKFTAAGSFNFDVRLSDRVWWRVLQPSVLFYKFGEDLQADYRIATGLVLRGGEILQ